MTSLDPPTVNSSTCNYSLVDVFSPERYRGNPLAVVHGGEWLDTRALQSIANWMNLSETIFILPPTRPEAEYRVRIFTPYTELPFAGHPTLGASLAWLRAGGRPRSAGFVVQQCDVGLITVRVADGRHSFLAPALRVVSPLALSLKRRLLKELGLRDEQVREFVHLDNGPAFDCIVLRDAESVLNVKPALTELHDLSVALLGFYPNGSECLYEVRAFPKGGFEDTVTGALHASIAAWLAGRSEAPADYVASQGGALGRLGRVHVQRDERGTWIGGAVNAIAEGTIRI